MTTHWKNKQKQENKNKEFYKTLYGLIKPNTY